VPAEHPFTKEPIPVWIGDYVLAGRNRAVMAVPCGDVHALLISFKGQAECLSKYFKRY
jgi:leucyl-tRNA synthetase